MPSTTRAVSSQSQSRNSIWAPDRCDIDPSVRASTCYITGCAASGGWLSSRASRTKPGTPWYGTQASQGASNAQSPFLFSKDAKYCGTSSTQNNKRIAKGVWKVDLQGTSGLEERHCGKFIGFRHLRPDIREIWTWVNKQRPKMQMKTVTAHSFLKGWERRSAGSTFQGGPCPKAAEPGPKKGFPSVIHTTFTSGHLCLLVIPQK